MLEGEAVVDAKVAIYDPQSAFGAVAFRANGSKAERLAIVLNRSEAAAISGLKDARQAGAWVLKEEAAEVVVLKMGPAGALVITADRKSVGSGKSVSVRVDLGGRRIIKKKKKNNTKEQN